MNKKINKKILSLVFYSIAFSIAGKTVATGTETISDEVLTANLQDYQAKQVEINQYISALRGAEIITRDVRVMAAAFEPTRFGFLENVDPICALHTRSHTIFEYLKQKIGSNLLSDIAGKVEDGSYEEYKAHVENKMLEMYSTGLQMQVQLLSMMKTYAEARQATQNLKEVLNRALDHAIRLRDDSDLLDRIMRTREHEAARTFLLPISRIHRLISISYRNRQVNPEAEQMFVPVTYTDEERVAARRKHDGVHFLTSTELPAWKHNAFNAQHMERLRVNAEYREEVQERNTDVVARPVRELVRVRHTGRDE